MLLPLGLLYYAGHGYENFGNSFMVPVDAPNPYRSGNCLCVQSILKLMQEKETGLNVFLLDMCRKRCEFKSYSHWFKTIHTLFVIILTLIYCFRNLHDDATPNVVLKVTANIVFGYATWVTDCLFFHPEITCWSTFCSLSDMLCWDISCLWSCQDAEAFELSSSGFTNGVFIKFLKERLLEDEKITVLLDRVAEGEGTLSMLKLNEALQLLLVKYRSIKLKQMINWFEKCTTTFSTYLFCTLTTTSNINFKD